MRSPQKAFGLYLHIPYCQRLCHYCDFVKTARFAKAEPATFVQDIRKVLNAWQQALAAESRPMVLDSVFLGGGTPSLLTEEYRSLFQDLMPYLSPGAELTLEANPEHCEPKNLQIWRDLGINRLSLGVQSFQETGLKVLTREHSPETACLAVKNAAAVFANVSVDLIYGWPGQNVELWQKDLETCLNLPVQHLSLYALTLEGQTPFARRHRRGVMKVPDDEMQERFYLMAQQQLRQAGFWHEEVSNWYREGSAAFHNSIYWHGGEYLGLGPGAHSYLHLPRYPLGLRFSQEGSFHKFQQSVEALGAASTIDSLLSLPGLLIEEDRDEEAYIFECVSSGLRTERGINLDEICKKTGYSWQPRTLVQNGLQNAQIICSPDAILTLKEEEWLRETSWSLEVSLSFRPQSPDTQGKTRRGLVSEDSDQS